MGRERYWRRDVQAGKIHPLFRQAVDGGRLDGVAGASEAVGPQRIDRNEQDVQVPSPAAPCHKGEGGGKNKQGDCSVAKAASLPLYQRGQLGESLCNRAQGDILHEFPAFPV
jgi:hypothetical protein